MKTPRLRFVSILLAVAVAAPSTGTPAVAQQPTITVATWSGVYGAAQQAAVLKPFTRATGIGVRIADYDGDLGPLRAKDRKGGPPWDVVDVGRAALDKGCADGIFDKLDPALLLGKANVPDFVPGLLTPCGIGALIWSQAIAFDATAFKKQPPTALAAFFDLDAFPGKRGLFAGAEGNLEIALMADGVPPRDVYDILRTAKGVDRAFAKLQTIKPALVFWRGGDEPAALLNDGTVTMTTAYAARFLRPRHGARRPAGVMWQGQLWRATYWAIPAGHGDTAPAQRFVTFATDPERLANLASRLRYGPARKSAVDMVPAAVRDDLPTARRRLSTALQVNAAFWAKYGAALEDRFRAWRGG